MISLKENLKKQLIEQLNLEDIQVSDIRDDAPLFGDGLDSIDALELIVLMEKNYGIKITEPEKGKEVFYSVNSMADYIVKMKGW